MPNPIIDLNGNTAKQFNANFNKIQKAIAKERRNAQKTLTPAMLKRGSDKDLGDLGQKTDGTSYTLEDLYDFRNNKKTLQKIFDHKKAGIPRSQIIAGSTKIDIDRANNAVSDGTGVNSAVCSGMVKNEVISIVKASVGSKDSHHRVRIRFESFADVAAEAEPTTKGYIAAVKKLYKGNLSFDCDCGRNQYGGLRYMATIGNYGLRPKEYAYPKEKNPTLRGIACKHVLLTLRKMDGAGFVRTIASGMSKLAKKVGFGDDPVNANFTVDEEEFKKAAKKDRIGEIDQEKYKSEFKKHLKAQNGIKKRHASDADKIKKLEAKLHRYKQENSLKGKMEVFVDAATRVGASKNKALKAFAEKHNLSAAKIKALQGKK